MSLFNSTITSLVSSAGFAYGYTEAKIETLNNTTRIKGMKPSTFARALGTCKVKHLPTFLMGDPTTIIINTSDTDYGTPLNL